MLSVKTNIFRKNDIILIPIILFGLFLYLYKLGNIPSGFYIDEALPGYNAYSLLLTGKDEYGKFFPIALRFYGSYNPPLFTYLVIPSIYLFGLNILSVRLVSSLAGLFTGVVLYKLIKISGLKLNIFTPYIGILLFIISPWVILHSRVGYEVSLGLLLFSLGVYFFWKGLSASRNLIYGFIFLSLSTYAAYAERFLVPMFVFGFVFLFRKKLFTGRVNNDLKKGIVIASITQIPHFLILFTPAFFPKYDLVNSSFISDQAAKILFLPYSISYILSYLREFLSQYATYFSPRSLFFLPDPDLQRSMPELSSFYFWMIIPYLVGLYLLWQSRKKEFSRYLILLLLISPIPAALTRDPFSTHRAFPLVFPLVIVISLGINFIISSLKTKTWVVSMSFLILFSLLLLWRSYFVLFPNERARHWGYGLKQLSEIIKANPKTNFVIDQARIKPTYIQLAFFLAYSPEKFQKNIDPEIKSNYYETQGFNSYYNYANIETRNVNWKQDIYKKQILVGDSLAISEQQEAEHFLEKVFEIKDPLGEIVFAGFETNPDKKCTSTLESTKCN